jgi:hypothetical protein
MFVLSIRSNVSTTQSLLKISSESVGIPSFIGIELTPDVSSCVFNMEEIWKDIPDYEGLYQASTFGRIRGVNKTKEYRPGVFVSVRGKVLKACSVMGYMKVCLYNGKTKKTLSVHRLIAITFIPTNDLSLKVNHKDFNKKNCDPLNLEWCTQRDNVLHSVKHGVHHRGERTYGSKLTDNIVSEIRKRFINGELQKDLAYEFGVGDSCISSLISRRTWKHI